MSIKANAPANYGRRKIVDSLMRGLMAAATLLAVIPLVLIIGYVLFLGGNTLSVEFFTSTYEPPAFADEVDENYEAEEEDLFGDSSWDTDDSSLTDEDWEEFERWLQEEEPEDLGDPEQFEEEVVIDMVAQGGILHAIVGTLLIASVGLLIAMPIGILAGIFLSEYGNNQVAMVVRFATDVLSGAPSIIVGVLGYILLVQPLQEYIALAGSVALSFLMVPTITRTTEEMLKLVPAGVREAALALGSPVWYSTLVVVIPAALRGIITGIMLAFSRGAGETAPLILTVLGSIHLSFDLLGPMAALPLSIYRYNESPFPTERALTWGTAFVLVVMVLAINILVRLIARKRM